MNRSRKTPLRRSWPLATILFGAIALAQVPIDAPITNFKLPLFNDAGYRTGYLRGEQGIYLKESEIRILGMELSQYTGDERDAVIGKIESPEALFRYDKTGHSNASGPGSLLIENETFTFTGEDWIWQELNNQVVINKNVKIVINEQIGDIIK